MNSRMARNSRTMRTLLTPRRVERALENVLTVSKCRTKKAIRQARAPATIAVTPQSGMSARSLQRDAQRRADDRQQPPGDSQRRRPPPFRHHAA